MPDSHEMLRLPWGLLSLTGLVCAVSVGALARGGHLAVAPRPMAT